ncbi:MAG: hypothetical protein WCZ87_06780 [Thiohalobacteraceae bacterium]
MPDVDGVRFEIESFVICAGRYERSGVGRTSGGSERFLNLDGPGDWEISTGLVPSQGGWDWNSLDQLPATMPWPGDAWYFGDEILSRIVSLDLQAVQWLALPGIGQLQLNIKAT